MAINAGKRLDEFLSDGFIGEYIDCNGKYDVQECSYSSKRGHGTHIFGPGIMDHFVSDNPKLNTFQTLLSVERLINDVTRSMIRDAITPFKGSLGGYR